MPTLSHLLAIRSSTLYPQSLAMITMLIAYSFCHRHTAFDIASFQATTMSFDEIQRKKQVMLRTYLLIDNVCYLYLLTSCLSSSHISGCDTEMSAMSLRRGLISIVPAVAAS